MPVLKHAKKKLRQDKKRTLDNLRIKNIYKKLLKAARLLKTDDTLSAAYQAIDKAAKKNIIHENKAARLKSSLARTVSGTLKEVTNQKKSAKAAKAAKAVKSAKKQAKARQSSAASAKTTSKKKKKK
jgi:small subunit ribosomal protein S20